MRSISVCMLNQREDYNINAVISLTDATLFNKLLLFSTFDLSLAQCSILISTSLP